MIIVSQDKNKIVNFDNIAHIFISKDSDKHYLIEYGKMNGSSELLGIYATEERAKEVLQEIVSKYREYVTISNLSGNDIRGIYNVTKVYEMPND